MVVAVSVCDKNYADGMTKMIASLRKWSDIPVIQISPDGFTHYDADATHYVNLDVPTTSSRYKNTFYKLEAFNLPYDTIVAVDSDIVFLNDPTPSWQVKNNALISLCHDDDGLGPYDFKKIKRVNSGYMVIRNTTQRIYEIMMEIAMSGESYDGGDQGVINIWCNRTKNYAILPIEYNIIKRWEARSYDKFVQMVNSESIIGLHMVGKIKPWNGSEPGYKISESLWHNS